MSDQPETKHPKLRRIAVAGLAVGAITVPAACTVAVKAPEEPITINLNVKIDQEVRIRLDKEVEDLISDNPDLFGTGE